MRQVVAAATAIRVARGELRRALKAGELDLRVALDDPRAQGMTAHALVASMPFSRVVKNPGRSPHPALARARRVLEIARVETYRKVRDIAPDERDRVALAYRDFHREAPDG